MLLNDSFQVERQYTYWRRSCMEFIFSYNRDSTNALTPILVMFVANRSAAF